jgi:hypothetical protein
MTEEERECVCRGLFGHKSSACMELGAILA